MAASSIRTRRLLLRRWREDDLAPFAGINADPEVARYVSGRPMSASETHAALTRIERHWAEWGFGLWAVEHVGDRRMIGFVGLSHHAWYPEDVEVGWRLERAYWGRGLATEGAAAVLAEAFGGLGLERVISIVHRDNLASRRVMEKNGLAIWREEVREREETGELLPIIVYAIDREAWRGRSAGR